MSLTDAQYHEVEPRLTRMVDWWLRRCPPNVEREDALAAAWEGVCRAADRYDPTKGASFTTYVCIRGRGAMIDAFRKEWQIDRKNQLLRHSVEWDETRPVRSTPEDEHGTIMPEHILFRLQAMPKRTREIFLRYYWEGQTQQEVADEIGLTEQRVCQIMRAALLRLRKPNYELSAYLLEQRRHG